MTLNVNMCQKMKVWMFKKQHFLSVLTIFLCCGIQLASAQDEADVPGKVLVQPAGLAPPESEALAENLPVDEASVVVDEAIIESDTSELDDSAVLDQVAAALDAKPLSSQVEDLKKAALELNRDLLILEEELLFPASTQIAIFLSVDVGKYFKLDSVKILIDDKLTASHLYTKRQNRALSLGGLQRIYLGNIKSGEHEVTAFFVGIGPDNREYKRGATIIVDKDDEPKMLELQVRDSSASMQPEFKFKEWEL